MTIGDYEKAKELQSKIKVIDDAIGRVNHSSYIHFSTGDDYMNRHSSEHRELITEGDSNQQTSLVTVKGLGKKLVDCFVESAIKERNRLTTEFQNLKFLE